MENNIKEKLLNLRKNAEKGSVNFFNDGKVTTEDFGFMKRMMDRHNIETPSAIEDYLYSVAESYIRHFDFDEIELFLSLGLVYKVEDVEEDNTIKEGSVAYDNIVRYYTENVNSYLDENQTNDLDYYKFVCGRQGYIIYSELERRIEEDGLEFNGPKTFPEFRDLILSKELFSILKQEEEMKLAKTM